MGKVYIVGAGPGDPDLLTVKAARLLRSAEVVLHDALVSAAVLALVPPAAAVIDVGKRCGGKCVTQREIESLLVHYARAGKVTIRLKGGDPAIFGRTGEETEALRRAGVDFEIVPAVTCALAAAAAARIPLTDRRTTSRLVFTTAQRATGLSTTDWSRLHHDGATLAIYMPGRDYERISHDLRQAGLDPATPCVLVSNASLPSEQVCCTDVGHLADQPPLPAPSLLIVGAVAGLAREEEVPFVENATLAEV